MFCIRGMNDKKKIMCIMTENRPKLKNLEFCVWIRFCVQNVLTTCIQRWENVFDGEVSHVNLITLYVSHSNWRYIWRRSLSRTKGTIKIYFFSREPLDKHVWITLADAIAINILFPTFYLYFMYVNNIYL